MRIVRAATERTAGQPRCIQASPPLATGGSDSGQRPPATPLPDPLQFVSPLERRFLGRLIVRSYENGAASWRRERFEAFGSQGSAILACSNAYMFLVLCSTPVIFLLLVVRLPALVGLAVALVCACFVRVVGTEPTCREHQAQTARHLADSRQPPERRNCRSVLANSGPSNLALLRLAQPRFDKRLDGHDDPCSLPISRRERRRLLRLRVLLGSPHVLLDWHNARPEGRPSGIDVPRPRGRCTPLAPAIGRPGSPSP